MKNTENNENSEESKVDNSPNEKQRDDPKAPENKAVELNEQQQPAEIVEPKYPSREWFIKWRETLLLGNLKSSVQHTYNKALSYRDLMMQKDPSYQGNQVVNINEDELAAYLKKFSLKGLLPKMPNILVTTYRGNQSIDTWLISYLWGLVFIQA